MPRALAITGLRKVRRGCVTAVSNLDLELAVDAFFGLLGPNGAGKTTLIGSVSNVIRPTVVWAMAAVLSLWSADIFGADRLKA